MCLPRLKPGRLRLRQQLAGEDPPDDVSVITLFFHEDGVPSFRDTSRDFWSWNSLSTRGANLSRQAIIGLPSSRVLASTRAELAKVTAWDMKTLASGVRPAQDHLDNTFAANSWRARVAGQSLGVRARFDGWKGDVPARISAHRLDVLTRNFRDLD